MLFKENRICEICNKKYMATSTTNRWCKNCIPNKKARTIFERYGLTLEEIKKLKEKYNGICPICNKRKASVPSKRIEAIKKLQDNGFDVAIRLSPLIEEYIDFDKLNKLGIKKAQVEFLRINHWIKQWFNIDYSKHTIKQSGYDHLSLDEKIRIINKIKIPEISVCEDENKAYEYWKNNFNPNKEDCCNLRNEKDENN